MAKKHPGPAARHLASLALLVAACQPVAEETPPRAAGGGGSGGAPAPGSAGVSGSSTGGSGAAAGGTGGDLPGAPAPGAGGTGGGKVPGTSTGGAGGGAGPGATGGATGGDAAPAAGGASAGCGKSNPAGTFMIMAGNAQTPYRVVLPAMYDSARPYPVVFYLHGRGNNIEGQSNLTRDVAGANLGIVVYPKSFGGSGWEVPNRDRPEENLALLKALVQRLGEQYCIDSKRIIMSGFSSGCWFASRLACTMKDQLAAVVAAGCGLDPMGRCPDRKPVTYIIGRGDGAFSGAPAAAEFYRNRNGCQMTRKPAAAAPCEEFEGCAPGLPTAYCPHPGGHQWPGFAGQAVVELLKKL
jgi:poly(3-hydroxybutyrate) depolymerase